MKICYYALAIDANQFCHISFNGFDEKSLY